MYLWAWGEVKTSWRCDPSLNYHSRPQIGAWSGEVRILASDKGKQEDENLNWSAWRGQGKVGKAIMSVKESNSEGVMRDGPY